MSSAVPCAFVLNKAKVPTKGVGFAERQILETDSRAEKDRKIGLETFNVLIFSVVNKFRSRGEKNALVITSPV